MDDDVESLIVELHQKLLSSGSEIILSEDETADEELRETVDCLNLIERVRQQEELQTFLESRKPSNFPPHSELPKEFAHYQIKYELGRGGAGSVWLANDTKLKRPVALKIPHPHFLVQEKLRQRFILEASVTARLSHPHIVKIFEFGNEGPITYYASEYCNGPNLEEWQVGLQRKVTPRVAATIVRDLALAVEHAHANAVIHRDIKPSNVMVVSDSDQSETAVPFVKLCDFSLAKLLEGDGQQTGTGDLLGTAAYMSPEQAVGRNSEIDTRTDVYSLGVLLFELLVGNPPFEGENRLSILYKVIHEEAPDVRRLRKDVPVDLAVIVARCLVKPKEERFQTARELAEDLNHFLLGMPIASRSVSWWERLSKWARRKPAAAIATALGILFPLVLLGMSLWINAVLYEKTREIMQRLYVADMRSAKQAIDDYRLDEARELLGKYQPSLGTPDVRTLPWQMLNARIRDNSIDEWKCHDGDIYSLEISPNGKLLATASRDGTAGLWNYPSARIVHRLVGHHRDVNQARFSPDGLLLATCGDDGTLRLWDVETGKCHWTAQAHSKEASCLSFHPDGTKLVSGGHDQQVRVWRVRDGVPIGEPIKFNHRVSSVEFALDGLSMFVATNEPRLERIRTDATERVWPQSDELHFRSKLRVLVVAPRADRILTGEWDGEIHEIDPSGKTTHKTRTDAGVTSIRLLPSGAFFVVTRENGKVELRELQSGEDGVPIYASRSRIWDSQVVGSQKVIIACADGHLRQIPLPDRGEHGVRTLARISGDVQRLLISLDGTTLYAAGQNTLAVIDSTTGRILHRRTDFPSRICGLALSTDESLIVTGEESGRVCLWATKDLAEVEKRSDLASDGPNRSTAAICFLNENNTLLIGTGDEFVVWDRGKNVIRWRKSLELNQILSIVPLSDGRMVAACDQGVIGLEQSGDSFVEIFRNRDFHAASPICVKPGDEYFFVGDQQGGLHRVRQGTGSVQYSRFTPGRRCGIDGLSMSRSGKLLALGAKWGDGKLCLVDTDQVSAISTTVFRDTKVLSTAFSLDEKTMFAGLSDGRIIAKACDAFDNDTFIFPTSSMKRLKSSPIGDLVVVVDNEDWLKLYQTNPLKRVPSWLGKDFELASFSADGSEIILSHKQRIHRALISSLDDAPPLVRTLDCKIKEIDHINRELVVVRDERDVIRIVELKEGGIDRVRWKPEGCFIERMALSSDKKRLVLATTDRKIHLIDLSGEIEQMIECPGFVRSLACTPDGHQIAVGLEHGSIHFLDIRNLRWGTTFHYPDNLMVRAIAFASDGKTMLSSSTKGGIQVWNLTTGEIVFDLNTEVIFEDIVVVPSTGDILACGRDGGDRGVLKVYRGNQVRK